MSAGGRPGVVITGVGAVTGFGLGASALADGLRAGGHALRPVAAFDGAGLGLSLAAEIPAPIEELPDFPDDRKSALAMVAAEEAVAAAGGAPLSRGGIWLGTGLSSLTPRELEEDAYPHLVDGELDGLRMMTDHAVDRVAPRRHHAWRAADALAARFGLRGPRVTSFSACAAGSQAIAEAFRAIRRGEVDAALTGGHDSMIHPLGVLSFVVLRALSPTRCRPFDKGRDGFTIGEGAAILVLEREDAALRRGARILARVLGAGTSVDAYNVTAPHPDGRGAALSMRRALADAGLDHGAVDHINGHGTGTPVGDVAEARAVASIFGERVPVSSIKGAVGHCIAAAGAVEAAACVAGLVQGWTPGTAQLEDPAPLGVTVQATPAEDHPGVILSNSFGFGGQNCTLVLGAPGFTRSGAG